MIIVEDVHKRYRTDRGADKWVLQGVNFTIPPKLNVGLVGCNGAGKSTLLRLIGGVDTPTRGRIERHCRVSWPMGFGGGLQGSLTGRQNAKFVCRIHGFEEDIPDRIAYIQEFTELGEFFDEPVKTYSSGMRSRLQFGLSLAFDFDLYISDEVTSAGDASFREKAVKAFESLADHASLIMVSHGEGTLRQFCKAGIWLDEGQAFWFDDIKDAIKEYNKKQLINRVNRVLENVIPENQPSITAEIESARNIQAAMATIDKGLSGDPAKVDHETALKIIHVAKQMGMKLVGPGQLAQLGYSPKSKATPVLRKAVPEQLGLYVDLFELYTQCLKLEKTK